MNQHELEIRRHEITGTAYVSMDDISPTPICEKCVERIIEGWSPASSPCLDCMKLMKSEYKAMRRWQRKNKVS